MSRDEIELNEDVMEKIRVAFIRAKNVFGEIYLFASKFLLFATAVVAEKLLFHSRRSHAKVWLNRPVDYENDMD